MTTRWKTYDNKNKLKYGNRLVDLPYQDKDNRKQLYIKKGLTRTQGKPMYTT